MRERVSMPTYSSTGSATLQSRYDRPSSDNQTRPDAMDMRAIVVLFVSCCISGLYGICFLLVAHKPGEREGTRRRDERWMGTKCPTGLLRRQVGASASFPWKPYCLACVPSNCGRPRDPWDLLPGRTYGGSNSTRGRYPWHAIVYADGQPIGGGALVSCNFVLTTAYLVQDYRPTRLQVKLGKTDLDKESPTERTYAVYQRVLHPRWDPERDLYSYDLALLQLERVVDFPSANGYINTICLPEPRVDAQGWLTLTSFGYDQQGRRNRLMQEVNILKLRGDQCPLFRNKPYAFCGVGQKSGICTGDRGSPVVQMAPTGEFTLVGVANDYQCQTGGTDVYTQISYFLNFVCNIPVEV